MTPLTKELLLSIGFQESEKESWLMIHFNKNGIVDFSVNMKPRPLISIDEDGFLSKKRNKKMYATKFLVGGLAMNVFVKDVEEIQDLYKMTYGKQLK